MNGNWDKLIELANITNDENIHFKYLEQRIGYAYFMKKNFYKAIEFYQKSLSFDTKNEISNLYLYYSAINIGDESMARYYSSKLPENTQKNLNIKSFKPIQSLDFEYNYKLNNNSFRSNPEYFRLGLNSQFSNRLSIYLSASRFSQIFNNTQLIDQNEFLGSLTYSLFDRTNLSIGYHYLNINVNDAAGKTIYPGNIYFGNVYQRINRFDFSIIASKFYSINVNSTQLGLEIGYLIPSKSNIYLKSKIFEINDSIQKRIVFSQSLGISPLKNIWLEGSVTLGNLNNYVEENGLYVYNSLDKTTFRTGASLFWYITKHFTFYTNYTFDRILTYDTNENYVQHSITGGLIWKL
jgi:hypothetical protein